MILFIPCCGDSERFYGNKKQFLRHPNGLPLPLFSASGITGYTKRFFIFLQNDFCTYGDTDFKHYRYDEIIFLNHRTVSPVQTVTLALQVLIGHEFNPMQPIYIKDCDNFFKTDVIKNCVATIHPKRGFHRLANINNKSYSLIDNFNRLHCIKERGMYTNYMNVGGYGFNSAFDFLIYSKGKRYITEVIQNAINNNEVFTVNDVSDYIDYGTQEDWDKYLALK